MNGKKEDTIWFLGAIIVIPASYLMWGISPAVFTLGVWLLLGCIVRVFRYAVYDIVKAIKDK